MSQSDAAPKRRLLDRILAAQPRHAALLVFLAFFAVYVASANYSTHQDTDVISTSLVSWFIAQHHTIYVDPYAHKHLWVTKVGGHWVSNRFPGTILLAVPAYWLLGGGFAKLPFYPGTITAAVVTAVAMAVMFVVLRRVASQGVALVGTLVLGLATGTWTVSANALWTHGPDQLWLGLMLLFLADEHYLSSGLAFGLAIFTRAHLAVAAAVTGIAQAIYRRSLGALARIAFGSVLGGIALLLWTHWLFDTWNIRGGYSEGTLYGGGLRRLPINFAGAFVSPERGLLVFSPYLLLLVPGAVRAWRVAPAWVRSTSLGGITYLIAQLYLNRFSGGDGFYSYRLPIETLTMMAPMFVLMYTQWTAARRWRRATFGGLLAFSVAVHSIGAFQDHDYGGVFDPWRRYTPWVILDGLHIWALVVLLVAVVAGILWVIRAFARLGGDVDAADRSVVGVS